MTVQWPTSQLKAIENEFVTQHFHFLSAVHSGFIRALTLFTGVIGHVWRWEHMRKICKSQAASHRHQGACRIKRSILFGYGNFHKSFFLCTFLKLRVKFRRKRLSIVITFKSLSPSYVDRKTKKKWLFMITLNLRYSILIPVREQCNSTFTNPALCLTIPKLLSYSVWTVQLYFHATIFSHLSLQHTLTLIFPFQT